MQANNNNHIFNSPMSLASSCSNSPFTSPESCAELDILDLPMFFPTESVYQPMLDLDGRADQYNLYQQQQKQQQQQFQYDLAQIGLGTPPTSPASASFQKYNQVGSPALIDTSFATTDVGTMYYNSPTTMMFQPQHQFISPYMGQVLNQQFDALDTLFSPSSQSSLSSVSSSLTDSPLTALGSDFDLFPLSTASKGYPSAPVIAPMTSQAVYSQASTYGQMTPPMHQMDLEREVSSLFKREAAQGQAQDFSQTTTTEMSLLCKCPGKFPCGPKEPVQAPGTSVISNSTVQEVREYSESETGSEEDEEEEEEDAIEEEDEEEDDYEQSSDPSYTPASKSFGSSRRTSRPKSMHLSGSAPYSSPFTKETAYVPRQDRRRSSSGSYSSDDHSHAHYHPSQQHLLDPEKVPEIKDIHVCPVCQRRFTRPFNLRSHLMTHTTARPFPCDECHWKFTRQHDLLRHKRAKHPGSTPSKSELAHQKSKSVSAA